MEEKHASIIDFTSALHRDKDLSTVPWLDQDLSISFTSSHLILQIVAVSIDQKVTSAPQFI